MTVFVSGEQERDRYTASFLFISVLHSDISTENDIVVVPLKKQSIIYFYAQNLDIQLNRMATKRITQDQIKELVGAKEMIMKRIMEEEAGYRHLGTARSPENKEKN